MSKPKVAFYWSASCGGCEEAVIDINETILDVVKAVDIVFWPVALDFKVKDVEQLKDGEITVSFLNGGIRSSEQEHMVKLLRKKSKIVVAFGSCAHMGGVPGLANLSTKKELLDCVYKETVSTDNPDGIFPQEVTKVEENGKTYEVYLPKQYEQVHRLDEIVDVDYYLPGCPPAPANIVDAVMAILESKLPPKGAVIGEKKTQCDTCSRKDTKPEKLKITKLHRIHEIIADPDKCFLDQGVICLGPATRSGCDERCMKGNMPCRGCYGPPDGVLDQGAKFLSALASIIDVNDEEEYQQILDSIPDPAGMCYYFSLPTTLLKKKGSQR